MTQSERATAKYEQNVAADSSVAANGFCTLIHILRKVKPFNVSVNGNLNDSFHAECPLRMTENIVRMMKSRRLDLSLVQTIDIHYIADQ